MVPTKMKFLQVLQVSVALLQVCQVNCFWEDLHALSTMKTTTSTTTTTTRGKILKDVCVRIFMLTVANCNITKS